MIIPPRNVSQNILFFLNSTPLNDPMFNHIGSIAVNSHLDFNSSAIFVLNNIKNLFKKIEPFQPPIAFVSTAARAAWKNRKQTDETKNLTARYSVITSYRKQKTITKIELQELVKKTIEKERQIEYEIQWTKHNQTQRIITTLQLASLFFPHPGYNIWNSSMNIASRAISVQFYASHAERHPDNKMHMVLSLVSAIASVLTACKQTEAIKEFDSTGHTIMALSFICMAIEAVYNFKHICHCIQKNLKAGQSAKQATSNQLAQPTPMQGPKGNERALHILPLEHATGSDKTSPAKSEKPREDAAPLARLPKRRKRNLSF